MPARRLSPIELSADSSGHGPTLVLLPSFAGHRESWGVAFTRALAERFTVIAVDWPSGMAGLTVPSLAAAVLDLPALRAGSWFRLLGWGLGALVGLQLAVTAPRRLARAVLIGAVADGRALHARYPTVAALCGVAETATPEEHMLGLLGRVVSPAWRPFAELFLPQLLPRPADSRAALRVQWQALATFDLRPRLAEIHTPLLLLAGGEDTLTPPERVTTLATALPDARAQVIAGAGHAAVWERPGEVLAAALPFLEMEAEAPRHVRGPPPTRRRVSGGTRHEEERPPPPVSPLLRPRAVHRR
jgi:pimeloyl-ACP methyl ester carboxylesterase